ncbi:MAG: hypothetical protein N2037_13810, partial [Acidimicrobiales bacterium]|nr:hypothetical protein [Acidimicrobiales bacterium]
MTTTSHPTPVSHRRRAVRVALVSVAIGLVAAACNPNETKLMELTNGERAARAIPALQPNFVLWLKAYNWANKMASDGKLSHSNLDDGNPY